MSDKVKYALKLYTTVYGEWADGADEPEILDTSDELRVFDHLTEVRDFLDQNGLTEPSATDPHDLNTWLMLPDGTQPHGWDGNYTGRTETVTAHAVDGFAEREWVAVLAAVSA